MGAGSAALYLSQQSDGPPVFIQPQAGAFHAAFQRQTLSGNYLKTRFAQRHHDWDKASLFIERVLKEQPDNPAFIKRAMVLAIGAGEGEKAIAHAARLEALKDEDSALSKLFLALGSFKNKDYEKALTTIRAMPSGGVSDFIMPMLYGWSNAALGKEPDVALDKNAIHFYHAILIADYLKQPERVETLLKQALKERDLGPEELERIGDIYSQTGTPDKARLLYQQALSLSGDSDPILTEKLALLAESKPLASTHRILKPEDGIAQALYDMARLLAQEYSDESARIFAEMALYLNPQMTPCRLLVAHIAARNEQYDEAIAAYKTIPPEEAHYVDARRNAAELLDEQGKTEEALAELQPLATQFNDVNALVQIGDIYRIKEDYPKAISTYDKVESHFNGTLPADYWHVHYLRGMAYEQNKQWNKAETDLKAALSFQPDHPFVLNYLGYAWADQGVHLDEALAMIEKAVNLQPEDGYITDSLGWVYYRLGHYPEAVPHLEQAVELMPYDPVINDHLGDAYWKMGRTREAKFQWERAKNHAKDAKLIKVLDEKLVAGLPDSPTAKTPLKEAKITLP